MQMTETSVFASFCHRFVWSISLLIIIQKYLEKTFHFIVGAPCFVLMERTLRDNSLNTRTDNAEMEEIKNMKTTPVPVGTHAPQAYSAQIQ